MPMNKPAIDELLAQIPSYYELTVASALRARDIKVGNREHPQPLQTALEEVTEGKIETYYEAIAAPTQEELPLEAPAALPAPPVLSLEAPAEVPAEATPAAADDATPAEE